MTGEHLPGELIELAAPFALLVPPARKFDKRTYSPCIDGRLHNALQSERVNCLLLTGGETDVCLLATVLGAIDLGYRVFFLKDAVCSGADETYDSSPEFLAGIFPSARAATCYRLRRGRAGSSALRVMCRGYGASLLSAR